MAVITEHSFEVNGEEVDLHTIGMEPVRLESRFGEGAVLTLAQDRDHFTSVLKTNDVVAYKADGTYRFVGKVRGIARQTASDRIIFTVQDALRRASSVSIGISFVYDLGSTLTTNTVRAVLEVGIVDAGEVMGEGEGWDDLDTKRAKTHGIFAGTLTELIRQELPAMAEYRLIVNPAGGTEKIDAVHVYNSGSIQTLQWGGTAADQGDLVGRVADFDISESIDGTYTAVFLSQPDLRTSSSTYDEEYTLGNAWSNGDEADWFLLDAAHANAADVVFPADPSTSRAMVYRAWEIGAGADKFNPSQPWRFMVLVPAKARFGFNTPRWLPIKAEYVERSRQVNTPGGATRTEVHRYIVAKHPVTLSGNVRVKGKAKGPAVAKLLYQAVRGGGSLPTSVREPSAGFEGSAYTRYGVANMRTVEVSENRLVTSAYAREILDTYKEVRHTGRVLVYGRMPDWSWLGGSSVQVTGLTERGVPVAADYQAIAFIQTGWSINFAADMYGIEFTDDRSQFVDQDRLS